MKLTQNTILRILGWLHALLLFWSFYPPIAILLKADQDTTAAYCLTGILLLFPVIISWYAVYKIKYLLLYLLCALPLSLLFGWGNGVLGIFCNTGFYTWAIPAFLLSLVLFLIRSYVKIQKGKLQKLLRELPTSNLERVDYSELSLPVFLDVPHPAHWLLFAAHYVTGALLKESFYWHMIFALLFADVFVCFAHRFLTGFHQFLRTHSSSANLPVKTMKKVLGILFGAAFLVLFLFTIPSLLYGRELLSELNPVAAEEVAPVPEEHDFQPVGAPQNSFDLLTEAAQNTPPPWLAPFLDALFYLLCVISCSIVLTAIYLACKKAGAFFSSETEDDITFLEKDFSDQAKTTGKKTPSFHRTLSANLQIRKYYKKTLRKKLKVLPKGSETPAELETNAKLKENEHRQALHRCYEKARYSSEICTATEAEQVRSISKSNL